MTNHLYPLKFEPIIVPKIWGGSKLNKILNKPNVPKAGESWEISGVEGKLTFVSNGAYKGKDIKELLELEKEKLVGRKVFNEYGSNFPLLIKFIDAAEDLSVQVHPNNKMAEEKHNSKGKTEMWYVIDADVDAELNYGFKGAVSRDSLSNNIRNKTLNDILNFISVDKGDCFFIPAGMVHAIKKGVLIAEIQQTSDITYRLYDFDRKDSEGKLRELHVDEALEAIDYSSVLKSKVKINNNDSESELVACRYFKTCLLKLSSPLSKNIYLLDSFVIYMCVEGCAEIVFNDKPYLIDKGETVLMPASCSEYTIRPLEKNATLLEVYMP